MTRWSIFLNTLNFEMKYICGKNNIYAEMLSRLPLPKITTEAEKYGKLFSGHLHIRLNNIKEHILIPNFQLHPIKQIIYIYMYIHLKLIIKYLISGVF